MEKDNEFVDSLKLKLELSQRYGNFLDEQFSALSIDDAGKLARNINLMDECYARLLDIDRQLVRNASGDSIKWPSCAQSDEKTSPDLTALFLRTKEAIEENLAKIQRNRSAVLSKQGEIENQLMDLSKLSSMKNYFIKSQPGEFLNFSG
ncbi:MAG: hypothetical protein CO189_02970 [candidate division Zixibacteria bacterium CG_4_9_14_3_um_filter_46_8]|nr:MAG: hypothetical protein CO189_02970 [candidate division Zixibacteria bacterium CG_4_9_14_3_um_filter_46_8]